MPTVFVADDSALARRAIVRRVSAAGLVVVEGASAVLDAAVDVAGLSCALVDLDLGDGDGTQLASELRRRSPGLPIAFFTGGAPQELLARAAEFGPVFLKPAQLDQALAWITRNAT
jgi:two-component system response regulator FixJ